MILSLFPSLFTYQLVGIFVLRVVLGFIFLHLGHNIIFKLNRPETWIKTSGLIIGLVGILLILGLFTQAAALVTALLSLLAVIIKIRSSHALEHGLDYYLLLLGISIALLTLGAGAFAIDLPL